jgi:hypothetical protein
MSSEEDIHAAAEVGIAHHKLPRETIISGEEEKWDDALTQVMEIESHVPRRFSLLIRG